ncbi:MAG: RHS repeat-associated core domain-containing protein, partial [Planctomycetes bacterium]|nr:RHS repeat-associated core domain-containing protein [Planctomycetota bacterium]
LASGKSGAQVLAYDYRERLVEFHDVTHARLSVYGYDALGRRYKKVTDSGTPELNETRYFFDGGWSVLEERDGADLVVATYVREDALDALVEIARDATGAGNFQSCAVHADDLHSVLALSAASGALAEDYEYRDYGEVVDPATMQPLAGSALGNTALFSGRELDFETGLYQFRHRYLDPRAGRFVSRDPLGPWGDTSNLGNAQTYCANNPWSLVDPLGLDCAYPASALPPNVRGDLSTGTSDPVGVRGDCRTGSSHPQGVKGDCQSHGSVSRRRQAEAEKKSGGKSGKRVADGEHQADDRVRIAQTSAQLGVSNGEVLYCLGDCTESVEEFGFWEGMDFAWGLVKGAGSEAWESLEAAVEGIVSLLTTSPLESGKAIWASLEQLSRDVSSGDLNAVLHSLGMESTARAAELLSSGGFGELSASEKGELLGRAAVEVAIATSAVVGTGAVVVSGLRLAEGLFAASSKGVGKVGGKITGYTDHGLQQAIGRDGGRGVHPEAILDAVRNPTKVVEQAGGATKYSGEQGTVILNSQGKVVTTWGRPRNPDPRP